MEQICPISGETPLEEKINYWTHFTGLLLSIGGASILVIWTCLVGVVWNIVGASVYSFTLVALYAASTYYHGSQNLVRKRKLKILDHCCIFLLIAGSYTPFALGPLREYNGWKLLTIEWAIALFGIAIKIVAIDRFPYLSVLAYLVMGWLITFNLPLLLEVLPTKTLVLTFAGGLIYSFGTVFYLWESLRFNHGIWHLFTMAGSYCHYQGILGLL